MTTRTITLLLASTAWAALAHGQTPGSPGAPEGSGATAPVEIVPSGSVLVRANPASPLPNPDLTRGAAFPQQRGFFRAEPFFIYPFLGVGLGYNDNLTGTPDDPIRSAFFVISPTVRADVKTGGNTYALTYAGNYGHYFSSSANDFNEHAIVATSSNQFTARADLQGTLFYVLRYDPGGSVDRPFTGTPNRWYGYGANGTFGYGAPSAQGRLEFDLGFTDKWYLNNQAENDQFDVATWNVGARFFYRVAPKTRLLAEVRYTEYDYHQSTSPLDSSEQRYLLGATWDATAATSGTVRLGYVTKRFKTEGNEDYEGATAEASIRWQPRTYSTVEVVALYGPSDSTGTGLFTVDKSIGARWEHYWKSYFLTRALASYVDSDYHGVSRTDHFGRVTFGGYFDIRTWLRLGAEYSYENRRSTDSTAEYSRNVILLTISGTL